jgi:hypothetical protein
MKRASVSESCEIYYYEHVVMERRAQIRMVRRGRPSEKEEVGVWKEVKPVWAEPGVPPCAAKISWEFARVGFGCAFVVMRSEVDRGYAGWDHDGGNCSIRVDFGITVGIRGSVGGAGLIQEDDIL